MSEVESSLAFPRPLPLPGSTSVFGGFLLSLVALEGGSFQSLCRHHHSSSYSAGSFSGHTTPPAFVWELLPWKRLWLVSCTPRWPWALPTQYSYTVSMLVGSRFAVHIFIAYSVCGLIPRFVSAKEYFSTSVSSPTLLSEKHPAQPHGYASPVSTAVLR